MEGILDHLDAAEMRAVIVAQEFVVIARDIDETRALARLAQELLHDVVVRLRPEPSRFELPAIDDVADEIDGIRVVEAQEIEQRFGLTAFCAEMDVGQKQRPNVHERVGRALNHQRFRRASCGLVADSCCGSMTFMPPSCGAQCAWEYRARRTRCRPRPRAIVREAADRGAATAQPTARKGASRRHGRAPPRRDTRRTETSPARSSPASPWPPPAARRRSAAEPPPPTSRPRKSL